ncbi:MAG: DUF308 domain-containing protein [Methanoregula sp.]|nr:DUF308 domain-containing protein [Methanoregula sp.]
MVEQTVTSQQQASPDVRLFPWWLVLLWGIFAVLVGALFLAYPYNTLLASIVFLGVYWFVGGIFTLFAAFMEPTDRGWKILIAIISIIAGLVILAYPFYSFLLVPALFVILVGVWAVIVGGVKLYQGFAGKDAGAGILGVISIIFGLLLLVYPYVAAALIPYIFGGFALVGGIAAIIVSFMIRGEQKAA